MTERDVARWLDLANDDLAMADLAISAEIWRQACFHAQQAVEKALKGFLLARRGAHPKSHSLEQLLLFDQANELIRWRAECQRLDQFYLPTRYADALPEIDVLGADEAHAAVGDAKALVEDVRRRLEEAS